MGNERKRALPEDFLKRLQNLQREGLAQDLSRFNTVVASATQHCFVGNKWTQSEQECLQMEISRLLANIDRVANGKWSDIRTRTTPNPNSGHSRTSVLEILFQDEKCGEVDPPGELTTTVGVPNAVRGTRAVFLKSIAILQTGASTVEEAKAIQSRKGTYSVPGGPRRTTPIIGVSLR